MNSNEVTTVSISNFSSTLQLEKTSRDDKSCDYNPFANRKVAHPTTNTETLFHLLKSSLGSGILAMPLAFANGGIWFGLAATFIVGFICTYCVHILVKCSHVLCRRAQVPSLTYPDIVETALLIGPKPLHKWSRFGRLLANVVLVLVLYGGCIVYNSFVATNVKQVVEQYFPGMVGLDLRWYLLMLLPLLLPFNMIRNLKNLAPLSVLANLLMAASVIISVYYTCISEKTYEFEMPPVHERSAVADVYKLPMFFGTVIFALEGVGVIMSLENNMKHPQHFIGCPGVLNIGMIIVVCLYGIVGFLGYAKYGNETAVSITLNLPVTDLLAQSVKLSIAIAIFFTYVLAFFVPVQIIWSGVCGYFPENKQSISEYALRAILVVLSVIIAITIPNIGPFISLIGAAGLSILGLIFPSIIEIITYYERPGFGTFNWILWKNIFLIMCGIASFIIGTYVSLLEIYNSK